MTKQEVMNTMGAHVVSIGNQDQEYVYREEFDKLLDAFMLVQRQRDEEANGRCELAGVIESYDAEVRKLLTKEET